MDRLRKIFPHAFKATAIGTFIVCLLAYGIIGFIAEIIFGLLSKLLIIGFVFSIIGFVVGIYVTMGVVLTIINFIKSIKR